MKIGRRSVPFLLLAFAMLVIGAASASGAESRHDGGAKVGVDTNFSAVATDRNRLVVAGTTDTCGLRSNCTSVKYSVVVLRYRKSGKLDRRFGRNGHIIVPRPEDLLKIDGLVVREDRSIVVSVTDSNRHSIGTLLLGYTKAGKRDRSFGTNGVVTLPESEFEADTSTHNALAVLPDGSVVVAGTVRSDDTDAFSLLRIDRQGAPAPGFGSDGIAQLDFGPGFAAGAAGAVELEPGGDTLLVLGGVGYKSGQPATNVVASVRVDDGSLDPDFGSGGAAVLNDGRLGFAKAVGRISGGQIFLAPEGYGDSVCGGYGFYINSMQPDGTSPGTLFGGMSTAVTQERIDCGDLSDVARVGARLIAVGSEDPLETDRQAVSATFAPDPTGDSLKRRGSVHPISPPHFPGTANAIARINGKRAAVAGSLFARACHRPYRPGDRCGVATLTVLRGSGKPVKAFGRDGFVTFPRGPLRAGGR